MQCQTFQKMEFVNAKIYIANYLHPILKLTKTHPLIVKNTIVIFLLLVDMRAPLTHWKIPGREGTLGCLLHQFSQLSYSLALQPWGLLLNLICWFISFSVLTFQLILIYRVESLLRMYINLSAIVLFFRFLENCNTISYNTSNVQLNLTIINSLIKTNNSAY